MGRPERRAIWASPQAAGRHGLRHKGNKPGPEARSDGLINGLFDRLARVNQGLSALVNVFSPERFVGALFWQYRATPE